MIDIFDEARRLVSPIEVAEANGIHVNRHGKALCAFHHEKTPSLKFFSDGGWKCFGCGKSGNGSIDFAVELLDLTPLEAVRRLNDDFRLNLPIDRQQTPAERQEAKQAAQRRREISDTYRLFEKWRGGMIQRLNACFREGHLAMKSLETPADLDRLTDAQALAIREQARMEYYSDILTAGTLEEQMAIFRERGRIGQLCQTILTNSDSTPRKSGAA